MTLSVPPQSAQDPEDAVYRKVSWRLMPFLLLCFVAAYLDRVNIGFAKLQMLSDLQFSETVYGLGAGIFFIGYMLFEVPSNMILHRIGARRWIARIMISWGVISAAMMCVTTPTMFYLMRFLLGLAEAGFFPGIILYLTYWYPAHRRGRATTVFMTAVALSGVIGGPLSGWVMKTFAGVCGLAGWQWMFLIEGLPSISIGLFALRRLDDRIAHARWLSEAEKTLLMRNIAAENAGKDDPPLAAILANPRVWQMSLIYFSLVMGLYGVSFWLPTLIKQTGVDDPFSVGLLTAIPYSAAVIGMILTARSADRTRERRWHIAIPAIAGAIGLALSAVWHAHTLLALAALTLGTLGTLTALPLFWSLPTALLTGRGAAAGLAFINSLGNLAGFLSPYAVGWLKDATHSTDSGMYLLVASMMLGAMLTLSVPARSLAKPP